MQMKLTESIGASVSTTLKEQYDRAAIEQSEAGDKVTTSQLVRQALQHYAQEEFDDYEGVA